jgi:hypothetical protein
MRDYLGGPSTIGDPVQDVHWTAGAFGYFPSYTLGAMMAAQQWSALKKEYPAADDDLPAGDFAAINDWRREKIWSQGSRWSRAEDTDGRNEGSHADRPTLTHAGSYAPKTMVSAKVCNGTTWTPLVPKQCAVNLRKSPNPYL